MNNQNIMDLKEIVGKIALRSTDKEKLFLHIIDHMNTAIQSLEHEISVLKIANLCANDNGLQLAEEKQLASCFDTIAVTTITERFKKLSRENNLLKNVAFGDVRAALDFISDDKTKNYEIVDGIKKVFKSLSV